MKKIAKALVAVLGTVGGLATLCMEKPDSSMDWVAFAVGFCCLLTCYVLADAFIWDD